MDETVEGDEAPERRPQNVPLCFHGFEQDVAEAHACTLGWLLHEIGKDHVHHPQAEAFSLRELQ
ncbi:MAG: hypothetical protein EOS64_09210 [Mesorhizobium sp.]|nr:MAG: hypothetical protein EOS64_09210 [Mesorhizobium sp.]